MYLDGENVDGQRMKVYPWPCIEGATTAFGNTLKLLLYLKCQNYALNSIWSKIKKNA